MTLASDPVKIFFFSSKNGHVAYQIKGNEIHGNIQAEIVPGHASSTPEWGQKVKTGFYS